MLARKILQCSKKFFVQKTSLVSDVLFHQSNRFPFSSQSKVLFFFQCPGQERNFSSFMCKHVKKYSIEATRTSSEVADGQNGQGNSAENEALDETLDRVGKKNTVYMRGLPYNITSANIIEFFSSVNVKPCHIQIKRDSYGQSNGKAEVQFENKEEVDIAMKRHNSFIGHRYIELSFVPFPQMETTRKRLMERSSLDTQSMFSGDQHENRSFSSGYWVRLSGLPYEATTNDIYEFFKPLNLVPASIEFKLNAHGLPNGLCNVMFQTEKEALKSLKNDNRYIGNRYVKVYLSASANRIMQNSRSEAF